MLTIFDELDRYLSSDDSPNNCLMLSDLDGFLTGVACTPERIDEWQEAALGDPASVPERIVALVQKRLQAIQARLISQVVAIEPVFWQAPEGHVIAMDWCEGFMDAVKLRPEKWDMFAQTKNGAELMMPILIHMFDDDGNSLFGLAQEEIDEALDAGANAIPTIVPAIYRNIRILTKQ